MEDVLLEETRKRLLKSEDLLTRHMTILDAASAWISQVCQANGIEPPEDLFNSTGA